ncbi:MAG: DUF6141 family protein [Planctomycetota bacterium]
MDDGDTTVLFREVQRFTETWICWIVGAIVLVAWWTFVQQIVFGVPFGTNPAPDGLVWAILLFAGIGLPLFFFVARLVTVVTPTELRLRFVPLKKRVVPLGDVRRAEVRTYRPIREYGGWGIRYGFGRGWVWSTGGRRGVLFEIEGKKPLLVGSGRPEALAEALRVAGVGEVASDARAGGA